MNTAGGWLMHFAKWFVAGVAGTLGYRFTGWLVSQASAMFGGGGQ